MAKTYPRLAALWVFFSMLLTATEADSVTELKPGILVDTQAGIAYVMHPAGGIEALAVASGQSLWHSDLADQPIIAEKGRLLALVDADRPGILDLAVLDTATGARLVGAQLALPNDVRAAVDDGLGRHFQVAARAVGDLATLTWEHSKRVVQGMPTAAGQQVNKSTGALTVELETGQTSALVQLPEKTARLAIEGKYLEGVTGRQFLSSDGAHVLVSEPLTKSGPLFYRWQVFTLQGQLLGAASLSVSYSPFALADGLLLFVSNPARRRNEDGSYIDIPMHLHGIDLDTGKAEWSFDVRDTTYRGPFPS